MAKKVKLNRNETSTFTDTEQLYNKTKEQLNKLDFGEVTIGSTDSGDEIFLGVKGKNGKGTILSNYHGDSAISVSSNYLGIKIDNTTYNDNVLKVSDKGLYVRKSETGTNTGSGGPSYSFGKGLIESSGVVSITTGAGVTVNADGERAIDSRINVKVSQSDDNILHVSDPTDNNLGYGTNCLYVSKQEIKELVGGGPGPSGSYTFSSPLSESGGRVSLSTGDGIRGTNNQIAVKISSSDDNILTTDGDQGQALIVSKETIKGLVTVGPGPNVEGKTYTFTGDYSISLTETASGNKNTIGVSLNINKDRQGNILKFENVPGGNTGVYVDRSDVIDSFSAGTGINLDKNSGQISVKIAGTSSISDNVLKKDTSGALYVSAAELPVNPGQGGEAVSYTGNAPIEVSGTKIKLNLTEAEPSGLTIGNVDHDPGLKVQISSSTKTPLMIFKDGLAFDYNKITGGIILNASTDGSLSLNLKEDGPLVLENDSVGRKALTIDQSKLTNVPAPKYNATGGISLNSNTNTFSLSLSDQSNIWSGLGLTGRDSDMLTIKISESTSSPLKLFKDGLGFDDKKITGGLTIDTTGTGNGAMSLKLKKDGPLVVEDGDSGGLTIDQSKLTSVPYNGPTYSAGDGIQIISGNTIKVNLYTGRPGLEFVNGLKVAVSTDTTNIIEIKEDGIYAKATTTSGGGTTYSQGNGISISGNTISARVQTDKGIENTASGLGIKLPTTNSALQVNSNGLSLKLKEYTVNSTNTPAFVIDNDGLGIKISSNSDNQLSMVGDGLYVPLSTPGASSGGGGTTPNVSVGTTNIHFSGTYTLRTTKVSSGYTLNSPATANLTKGVECTLIIYNSGSSNITITMPTSGTNIYKNVSSISIPSGSYGEVSCVYDGTNYWIRAAV